MGRSIPPLKNQLADFQQSLNGLVEFNSINWFTTRTIRLVLLRSPHYQRPSM